MTRNGSLSFFLIITEIKMKFCENSFFVFTVNFIKSSFLFKETLSFEVGGLKMFYKGKNLIS